MASDDLYHLDLRQGDAKARWVIVPVTGVTPGRRYGHTMVFHGAHLFIFGGNTGSVLVNDTWCLSVEKAPFSWIRVKCNSDIPPARVYHSAAYCLSGTAAGMMTIFGGRGSNQCSLNDTWGLRRHRDGSLDWLKAPYKLGKIVPVERYQHSSLFLDTHMLIIGGRNNSMGKVIPFEIYDTETSEWYRFQPVNRFRHSSWIIGTIIYVHGGFQTDSPNVCFDSIIHIDCKKLFTFDQSIMPKKDTKIQIKSTTNPPVLSSNTISNPEVELKATEDSLVTSKVSLFHLSNQAHVAMSLNANDPNNNLSNFVRKVPVDELQEEGKKLSEVLMTPIMEIESNPNEQLYDMFINHIIKPPTKNTKSPFIFHKEHVIQLAKEFKAVLESQPMIIKIQTPIKIFGDLHGNLSDLLKIFELWKAPIETSLAGDIDSFAYLFLGNYVDRGNNSLETICLLMALKLKYPDTIILLRGGHEDRLINAVYGFGDECTIRLHEDINDPNSVFQIVNNAFAWLPLAAVIEERILCVHGGIGPNISRIDDLNKVIRPIEISYCDSYSQLDILLNCLWADPSSSLGYTENPSRAHINAQYICRFGPDVLSKFLNENKLEILVRSNEVAQKGIDTFADSKLVTITSYTNYGGVYKNDGCILVVQKTLEIIPKVFSGNNEIYNEPWKMKEPLTPVRGSREKN